VKEPDDRADRHAWSCWASLLVAVGTGRSQPSRRSIYAHKRYAGDVLDERKEDQRRQRKRTAASTNCAPQATRHQKILWPSEHPRTKYPQCGKL